MLNEHTSAASSPQQSLTKWVQSQFSGLYEHPSPDTSDNAQDTDTNTTRSRIQSMFTPTAQIYLNHTGPVPLEEFTKNLEQTFGTNKTEVEWKECFEVPDNNKEEKDDNHEVVEGETGIVAGYLIITRTLKFRIRATPAKNYTHVSLSAKIAREGTRVQGSDRSEEKSGDSRRIVQLFYTSASKAAPVHIQGVHRT
ncbi:hypothetical protein C8R41DRAFT_918055 [Lentinula lateritia]|uniref:Uncharacterized protein n=1 Tax=Lentinula lateritia TaxID=40482 RepID=A0ABQ8VMH6_9AGAR|nr:hypothetical protein C8R41DRAFT_918055 [Lentinula lateritia]